MGASRTIRVVVVDDQELFRIGVRGGLGTNGRVEIVAEGATEVDALRLTNAHHPDVVLLGLNTLDHPGPSSRNLSVFDTIRRLVKVGQTNVLVLSRAVEKGVIHSLLQAGASGFMLKDEAMNSCEVLEKAIESLAGKRKLPLTPSLYKSCSYMSQRSTTHRSLPSGVLK